MLPQSEFESPMYASAAAPVAIAALTQDRALIGLLRSTVDPSHDLILVSSETELAPHLNSRRVSAALLDSMFIEGDLAAMAERLRSTWPDLVLVVVGTAEEQSKVAGQITSGVVYRFLHRPVSAPRVRLFVEAALRRHEVENVERTLEQQRPDFSRLEAAQSRSDTPRKGGSRGVLFGIAGAVVVALAAGGWYALSQKSTGAPVAQEESAPVASPSAASAAAPQPLTAERTPEAPPPSAATTTAANAPTTAATPPAQKSVAETLELSMPATAAASAQPKPAVTDNLRPAASSRITESEVELAPNAAPTPSPPPALTRDQQLTTTLSQAESALQRGELATPQGRSAVDLFRAALELDPGNPLAKGGLVRVADRLLSAAERALTAGNAEDAKRMVDVAEQLTPATARGAFLSMQIAREHERDVLTRKRDADAADKQNRGATYLRLANTRLRSGALIEPSEDNARFYLEAARQTIPDDPSLAEISRALQKELLARAGAAASAGNAAETERWLANADGAGAQRSELAAIRRALQDTLIGARTDKVGTLAQSFTTALAANRLVQPADTSAKTYLLALINTDPGNSVTTTARQNLGLAYLRELRGALNRGDLGAADAWLLEARTIDFTNGDLDNAGTDIKAARDKLALSTAVVGANSLERTEYVEPKFPATMRNRGIGGWVELEFTVHPDGTTSDIVVTNSSPRKTFDSAAVTAISQWRYKPVVRDGKAVDQRANVRIRFAGN